MNAIYPPLLKEGASVSLVAPAGPISPAAHDSGVAVVSNHFDVRLGVSTRAQKGYLAGDDPERASDLQAALNDDSAAVLALRGGYGTTRILDDLDLTQLQKRPRWVVGSSDITALLMTLWQKLRLVTIHGPMPARFDTTAAEDLETLFDLLMGRSPTAVPDQLKTIVAGSATGPLVGGNLTVLAHMCGTIDRRVAEGCVLFLEDVSEAPYSIDRCLVQLGRSGILKKIAGVVLGEFTACAPGPDGTRVEDVTRSHFSKLGVPVVEGYPAAHGGRNLPFVHGGEVHLTARTDAGATIECLGKRGSPIR